MGWLGWRAGAKGREELSGVDEGEGSPFAQHGTDSHASE
jgi:hypothetical protein